MNKKEIFKKRNKIGDEIEALKKASFASKDYKTGTSLNKKIKLLKQKYTFYNNLLKTVGGNNDS